jgi:hypothetical protein
MPRNTPDIGSQGLEQGGANLGNDISRSITNERNNQNTTTPAVGSGSTENPGNESATPGEEQVDEAKSDGAGPDPETMKERE